MLTIIIVILISVVILFSWFGSIRILKPLIQEAAKNKVYIKEHELLKGIRTLQQFVGFALVVILWSTYINKFKVDSFVADSILVLALIGLVTLSILAYHNLKMALQISNYINSHQNLKNRYKKVKKKK